MSDVCTRALSLTPLEGAPGVSVSTTLDADGSLVVVLWMDVGFAQKYAKTGFWLRMPGGVDVLYVLSLQVAGHAAFGPALAYPACDPAPRMPDVWLFKPTQRAA